MKALLKRIVPSFLWKAIRTRKIVSKHAEVERICESLISGFYDNGCKVEPRPLKQLGTERIIWQYWAQGYENLPAVVKECLDSVEKFKGDFRLIRLDDSNVGEYVNIPENISTQSRSFGGLAHYSDLLRVALLAAYGGVWLDATVKLTGTLPEEYLCGDFFMFQRDPYERNKDYWENTYAYYFGWANGFRVNSLNSVIFSSSGSKVITAMYGLLSSYWGSDTELPDYFFFQILFDVLIKGKMKDYNCPVISDCLPHLLQQYRNDPGFNLMTEDEIYRRISIHKLTYKSE